MEANNISPSSTPSPLASFPAQEVAEEQLKLQRATEMAQPLYRVKAIFPFDLFPEELVVDAYKVDVISRYFFGSEQIKSIPLQEIASMTVVSTPFFASLQIVNRLPMNSVIEIKYLPIAQALEFRKLTQGLIVANNQKIDLQKMTPEEIVMAIDKLGDAQVEV